MLSFPLHVIEKVWQCVVTDLTGSPTKPVNENDDHRPKNLTIPFSNKLHKHASRVLQPHNIHLIPTSRRTIRSLLPSPKPRTPLLQQTCVVYRIPCRSCNQCYIGQTGQRLEQQLKHHRAVANAETATNSIAHHVFTTTLPHDIDWENTSILAREQNHTARLYWESWEIQNNSNCFNLAIHHGSVPTEYHSSLPQKKCRMLPPPP